MIGFGKTLEYNCSIRIEDFKRWRYLFIN